MKKQVAPLTSIKKDVRFFYAYKTLRVIFLYEMRVVKTSKDDERLKWSGRGINRSLGNFVDFGHISIQDLVLKIPTSWEVVLLRAGKFIIF